MAQVGCGVGRRSLAALVSFLVEVVGADRGRCPARESLVGVRGSLYVPVVPALGVAGGCAARGAAPGGTVFRCPRNSFSTMSSKSLAKAPKEQSTPPLPRSAAGGG